MIQFTNKEMNRMAIKSSLKYDEEIVCENATVIVDSKGNISWVNNDIPIGIFEAE